MEIILDRRSLRHIRQSALDAIQDGDTETLREDAMDAFNEEQIDEIERRLDSGDLFDFLSDAIDEWGGDDVDELFELLETHLSDVGIEFKYRNPDGVAADDDEVVEEEEEEEEEDDEYGDQDEAELEVVDDDKLP